PSGGSQKSVDEDAEYRSNAHQPQIQRLPWRAQEVPNAEQAGCCPRRPGPSVPSPTHSHKPHELIRDEVEPTLHGLPYPRRNRAGLSDARLLKHQVRDSDRAFQKAALAVGQVILPHPYESLVKAQTSHLRQSRQESSAPLSQGTSVARAEVFEAGQQKI